MFKHGTANRRGRVVLTLVAMFTALITALAPSASAILGDSVGVSNRGFAQVLNANGLRACDTSVDGRRVWGEYYLTNNQSYWTYNSPSGACTYKYHSIAITWFRVCVEDLACSGWAYNPYLHRA